ncbi:MAG: NAD(P)-dependent oxidoreductase, partial [Deltaproteobacteria bacterium]|nr:NAD(P)-dependent oxidoreductase [Deltaproteobacteria bacterium]
MTDGITDLSKETLPDALTAEICVIGSGSGGATAARLLAEAGHDVVVLEEGRDLIGPERTQRDGAMYDQLFMDRGGRATHDLSISVLQGRVLGGGGVVNTCDVVPIPEGVLHHWATKYGLEDFAPERFKRFTDDALRDLSASRIPESLVNSANNKVRQGAEGLGLRGEVMMHNRVGCRGLGTCMLGCPIHAKQNPRMVALPKAIEAGARIFTRARAVKIDKTNQEIKEITVRTLDPGGYREQNELKVRAKVVIVAANAISSAQLLLRSGVGNSHEPHPAASARHHRPFRRADCGLRRCPTVVRSHRVRRGRQRRVRALGLSRRRHHGHTRHRVDHVALFRGPGNGEHGP